MNRVENLTEDQSIKELQSIRADLDDIKTRQLTGDQNLLTYFVQPDTHITKTIAPFQDQSWYIYYYPNSQTRTYNYMEVKANSIINNTGFEIWVWAVAPQFINETTFMVWKLYFFNDSNTVDLDFSVGFRTIEEGTASWQEI